MVLVTGGTGLVGAHLLLHLIENGENVRAIYRKTESIDKTKSLFDLYKKSSLFEAIQWMQADITDTPSLENVFRDVDFVYHCAALISFDPKEEDLVRKTNIEGTANMVNFCLAKGIQKLCYLSSIAALGDLAPHEKIITEETEWNPEKPHSDYAISKYGAEMEIWRGQQEGLDVVVLNPGIIIGPGFREQGSGKLFSKVASGMSYYTLGKTGFVAVTDVVQIAFQLMKSEMQNERFTLIAQNIVFREVINSIADSLKVKKPSVHAKPFLIEIGWRIDWLLAVVFNRNRELTRATAKASYSVQEYSNEKIKTAIKKDFIDVHQYINEISRL
ncbi:NAD-dependent epimerase/dehydratase family protein [Flavobacterium sp. K5-23]|uniref:NAD-dependent epimerase/dehydratase family protein n=1 Tax=Flavobacterium sp. K5-23 TaxID=2746225 RepID=UPI00200C9002|nr:NAD-dependent epimerase/dehydratase family protein [Flavobacterium sp. K5-23]UQD55334.1 NAD-dependent epimerase/dehydratase family protein [Flavobacterium sp. K5-23]